MKYIVFLFANSLGLYSYGQNIDREFLGSDADYNSNSVYELTWSLGEIATSTYTGTLILTEGFQQVESEETTGGLSLLGDNISVFPNPTNGVFFIRTQDGADILGDSFELADIHNRKLIEGQLSTSQTSVDLDVYPAGVYILTIRSTSSQRRSIRVIKM